MKFLKKKASSKDDKNWYADRYQSVAVQRNFLALVTLISLVGVIVTVITLVRLANSKTVDPFVIEVERKTGITNVVRPLLQEQITKDEALRDFYVTGYINARESYNANSFEYNYYTMVRILSTQQVYSEFRKIVHVNNPESPMRFGTGARIDIKIKSITPLPQGRDVKGQTVQVRFVAKRTGKSNVREKERHLVANITFDYLDKNFTKEERYLNPLGFQVIEYQRSEEST